MKHSGINKFLSLDNIAIEGQNISYCVFGKGDIDLVIEMGLGFDGTNPGLMRMGWIGR